MDYAHQAEAFAVVLDATDALARARQLAADADVLRALDEAARSAARAVTLARACTERGEPV